MYKELLMKAFIGTRSYLVIYKRKMNNLMRSVVLINKCKKNLNFDVINWRNMA